MVFTLQVDRERQSVQILDSLSEISPHKPLPSATKRQVQTGEHTTETCTLTFTYYPCYNPAELTSKHYFSQVFIIMHCIYPLIGRHNYSTNSVAGDETQLRTMFQKHGAWGGKNNSSCQKLEPESLVQNKRYSQRNQSLQAHLMQ
jgi:hypothetical protein